jgi:PAS domain S-box-containing protein
MRDVPDTTSLATVDFWRSLVNSLPGTAVLVFDHELRYLAAGGEALEQQGMDAGEIEGRLLSEALPSDRVAMYEPAYRAALDGEASVLELASLDGMRIFHIEVAPITSSAGVVVGGMSIAQDVTVARHADRELRESERRYRLLAENSSDVVMRVRPDGVILYASPAVREVLGRQPDEMVGLDRFSLVHPDDRAELGRVYEQVARGEHQAIAVTRIEHASGGWVWLETSTRAIRDDAGHVAEFQSSSRDVTARVMSEQALRELEQRRDALMGQMMLSHDEERARIAAVLHDDTMQVMTAALLMLDRLSMADDPGALREATIAARAMLAEAVERARSITFELRPQLLEARGLDRAVEMIADRVRAESGCSVALALDLPRFRDSDEWLAYMTVQETVRSITPPGGDGRLQIDLHFDGTVVNGFVRYEAAPGSAPDQAPPGLDLAAERIRLSGGHLEIESEAGATSVRFELPVSRREHTPV